MTEEQLAQANQKIDSIMICEQLVQEIVEKAGQKIQDKLLNAMRRDFVKKQMMIQSTEAGLFGMNRVDRQSVEIEQMDETEEPVAPGQDNF